MKINFISDRVKISGPRVDGNYSISFDVGEYEYEQIMLLPKLNGNAMYVSVSEEAEDGNKGTTTNQGKSRA